MLKHRIFFSFLAILLLSVSCKKDSTVLSGEPPVLQVSAIIVNGPILSNNGQVTATDTVDFLIDVNASVGFNSVLIGGSGNTIITKDGAGIIDGTLIVEDLRYRVYTKTEDEDASATFIFVAVDQSGKESDSVRFSFTIVP
ncbi:MAG: hypothetical protein RIM99_17285 [Cyclobacteriaceae bacterium]